ncbi:hypothetical protein [Nonomuraea sp. NPDC050202]|jgi:hypothetical protein|uniref:hypothetical protein n=1 Tax=Nonomuraea sp. NPDC050202 TaxID=3155035 RepID=UPI0033FA1290
MSDNQQAANRRKPKPKPAKKPSTSEVRRVGDTYTNMTEREQAALLDGWFTRGR